VNKEQASDMAQQQQIPAADVLNVLLQRSARDKDLALHLEAAQLTVAVQMQQMTIQQMIAENEEEPAPTPAKAPRKK
jgi:hypothetical protein